MKAFVRDVAPSANFSLGRSVSVILREPMGCATIQERMNEKENTPKIFALSSVSGDGVQRTLGLLWQHVQELAQP